MYNTGNIHDLNPIDLHEVEDFIISPLNEKEYFNCNKNNLFLLKDYLLELKKQKDEYKKLIAKPLKSIQEKNPWCTDIQPACENTFIMEAKANNYPSILIIENGKDIESDPLAPELNPILNYIHFYRYSKRKMITNNSKDELLEIEKIIKSFGFHNKKEGLISASNHFLIIPYNFEEVHIQKNDEVSFYHKIKINDNNEFVSDYCGLTTFKRKKSKKYSNCFEKKLYLTKK